MKKILSLLAMLIVSITMYAQNPFFEVVNYRGAFAPAPASPWTDGWTNWDPQSTTYGAPTVTVSTAITTNTTWTSNNVYLIQGLIYVKNGATLTIQPGTVIRGDASVTNSSLVITKGSKINAIGNASNPIVFTSSKDAGARAKGDWGGVIILGKSTVNKTGGIGNIEGIATSTDTEYGGGTSPDDNDNSGNLKYVRIEYGGYVFATDQEINGLTLGGVGRNTIIDYVQCSYINDDAFEWFGGTVNASHLVAYKCLDDNFDTDNGFSGSVQFCLGIRDANISDQSSGSTSEGFESDNDAAGSANTPQTTCVFSNVTDISGFLGNPTSTLATTFKFRRGARLRRNSGIKILNSILMDAPYGVFIDGTACRANLATGVTVFKNNIVAGCLRATEPGTVSTLVDTLFNSTKFKNDSSTSTSGLLVNPYDNLSPDFRPEVGSLALSNVNFTDAAFNGRKIIITAASFIREVSYRGAFAPSPSVMWTDGWTNWDPNSTIYPVPTVTVTGTITANTTWTSDNTYLISGPVYVASGVTLTIQPGTVIRGDNSIANSSLIITKNAKLEAVGTVSNPIVFTSSKSEGTRAVGDWGGVILLGRASYNGVGGVGNIEGLAVSTSTEFGGGATPNDNDNSGTLKYVRIEFGGYVFATDKEINGLTMGAVGRGTTIDYVQCSFINDDAFEWFGGTVNAAHLVAYRCLDDNFDTDNGYNGSVQFCLGVRDPNISDQSSGSTSEGFESDNDAAGSANLPQTRALFSNITDISGFRGTPTSTLATTFKFRRGARIRRNSGLRIFNSILMDAPYGVFIDGTACRANLQSGVTKFKNNLVAGSLFATEPGTLASVRDSLFSSGTGQFKNDSLTSTANVLVSPYNFTAPDYRPGTSPLVTTGAAFTDSAFNGLIAPCDEVNTPGAIIGSKNIYGCTGVNLTRTYSIPAIVNATNYFWSVPTGVTIVSGQGTRTITVTFATTYVSGGTISVVGKNDCGNSSIPASLVVLKTSVATPASITGTANNCIYLDDNATYTTPLVANVDSYLWTVGDTTQLVDGQGTNAITVYFPSAVYRDTIKVQAQIACVTSAAKVLSVTTTKPANPSVLTGSIDVCAKIGANSVSDTVIYKTRVLANTTGYKWTVPANVNIVGGNGSNTITTADTVLVVTFNSAFVSGNISVQAFSPCGLSLSSKSLTVYKRVAAASSLIAETFNGTAAAIPAKTSVCGLSSATYRVRKVTYATGYNWTMRVGTYATISHENPAGINDTAVTVTFLSGYTRDTLSVQSVTPCSISAAKTAVLSALLAPPLMSTLTSSTGNTTPCIGNTVTYTAVALAPTTSQSAVAVYRWTKPNFTTITAATADSSSITVSYNTGYTGGTITAKTQSACGIAGTAKSLALQYLPPTPTAITSSTGLYNFCIGSTATFTATVGAPSTSQVAAVVYRWTKPTNTVIIAAAADSSSITLQFNTGYTGGSVTVKGQTACGAQGSAKSQSITHTGCPTGTRNLYTKGNVADGIKAQVFPNPNKGAFTVTINTGVAENTNATIQILDMMGRVMNQFTATNNNGVIVKNIIDEKLTNGVYTVKYTVGSVTNSLKMIINK